MWQTRLNGCRSLDERRAETMVPPVLAHTFRWSVWGGSGDGDDGPESRPDEAKRLLLLHSRHGQGGSTSAATSAWGMADRLSAWLAACRRLCHGVVISAGVLHPAEWWTGTSTE